MLELRQYHQVLSGKLTWGISGEQAVDKYSSRTSRVPNRNSISLVTEEMARRVGSRFITVFTVFTDSLRQSHHNRRFQEKKTYNLHLYFCHGLISLVLWRYFVSPRTEKESADDQPSCPFVLCTVAKVTYTYMHTH